MTYYTSKALFFHVIAKHLVSHSINLFLSHVSAAIFLDHSHMTFFTSSSVEKCFSPLCSFNRMKRKKSLGVQDYLNNLSIGSVVGSPTMRSYQN